VSGLARLVTHYFRHQAWPEDGILTREANVARFIAGVLFGLLTSWLIGKKRMPVNPALMAPGLHPGFGDYIRRCRIVTDLVQERGPCADLQRRVFVLLPLYG
jgi:hypothetical protein